MSLRQYCEENPAAPEWSALGEWYESFDSDDKSTWIRRNVDRECDRNDVRHALWAVFLHRLSAPPKLDNPCFKVRDVVNAGRDQFFQPLPGQPLPRQGWNIHRYISRDDFRRYHWSDAFGPSLAAFLGAIGSRMTGECLEGTTLGQDGYPVWCTDNELASETRADVIRNRLGLGTTGWLIEIAYPESVLLDRVDRGFSLYAPTFLDAASASDPENCLFCKRTDGASPAFGFTVALDPNGAGRRGAREAVHPPLDVLPGAGRLFALRNVGPLSYPPKPDYGRMLVNPEL